MAWIVKQVGVSFEAMIPPGRVDVWICLDHVDLGRPCWLDVEHIYTVSILRK